MYKFNFCLNCGGEFKKVSERLYQCPKCDLNYFIGINPVAGVMIFNSNNQILLTKRAKNPNKGDWSIPAGFVEFNENIEQGAKREVLEEVGLRLDKLEYFGSYTDIYQYKEIDYHTLMTVFTAKVPDEFNINLSDESSEFAFFDIDKIPLENTGGKNVTHVLMELMKLN